MRRQANILPCIQTMRAAGIELVLDGCTLVHLGRCGPQGTTKPLLASAMGVSYEVARAAIDRLEKLELVRPYTRTATKGRADVWAVSPKGWEMLTTPGVFPEFAHDERGQA
jgi:hypothetical protein